MNLTRQNLKTHAKLGAILTSFFLASPYFAAELSGIVTLDPLYFYEDSSLIDNQTAIFSSSVSLSINNIKLPYGDASAELFCRYDTIESSHCDISELSIITEFETADILWGVTKEHWGVAESKNLVDIINQTDILEDIDGKDKLGQPLIRITRYFDAGSLAVYSLFNFRERKFRNSNNRLSIRPEILNKSKVEDYKYDISGLAGRFTYNANMGDIGVHFYKGVDKEPIFLPVLVDDTLFLEATYNEISQLGLDLYIPVGKMAFKYEAIARKIDDGSFYAWLLGLERNITPSFMINSDITLFLEYVSDNRNEQAPITIYQNDIFLGFRLASTSAKEMTLKIGVLKDLTYSESFTSVELDYNYKKNLKLGLSMRIFSQTSQQSQLRFVDQDSHLRFFIKKYF